jgi:signal transduction histidine kinase
MTQGESQPGTYELPPLAYPQNQTPSERAPRGDLSLPEPILFENVLWFCRLRWLVTASLTVLGVMTMVPPLASALALRPRAIWPFVTAGLLLVSNTALLVLVRRSRRGGSGRAALTSLWCQIVSDLVILTIVVYHVGSRHTFAPFAYLFHIVLACIFFSRRHSLSVTLLACLLYIACVRLETTGILPAQGLLADAPIGFEPGSPEVTLNLLLALTIFSLVWYLTSHLSAMVRERDKQLGQTNRRLVAAREERRRHMLRTTHELKAPFAAIHANSQLLLKGYCGPLADAPRDVIVRIADRSKRLAGQIQDMLQLANLRSTGQEEAKPEPIDLADVLQWCITNAEPTARSRRIEIVADIAPARTMGVDDHLKMLFGNLITNAVNYCRDDGRVDVRCEPRPDGRHRVTIADTGIGIEPEKLPKIFDEYYRTSVAVKHNRESSGLGLAIVRTVAQANHIAVRVESQPNVGTTFYLQMPASK